jgi:hypothetical protein
MNTTKLSNLKRYRMLENGEVFWTGRARNPEHAEERCFSDEEPGELVRYTLQVFEDVEGGEEIWTSLYTDAHLPTD